MIDISHLSLDQQGNSILSDISTQIPTGRITAILGPNGAGKSSLLKCLTGATKNYTGNIQYDGRDLRSYKLADLAKKRAVLSQHLTVGFPFSVSEIVLMGRNPYSKTGSDREDVHIVDQVLALVDARHLKNRLFPSLSGGEQQRVQLARILAQLWRQTGACLFLDEPTSALDLKHQFAVLSLIQKLSFDQSFTVICVLHDLNMAKIFCDHAILLKGGGLHAVGEAKQIINPETINDVYQVSMAEVSDGSSGQKHLIYQLPIARRPIS
ncbi:heme ABC transporter ATP-binding protein [Sneathiella aquimaris]|uniref:heme ABC transporter ATP-binding protein n=1 Tax=Sneathiella aquimaris TaxID=2599305 RepID=UPI001469DDDB|nr:heme ABC transporter ATP-binding protein [Sneathiella aquimaris]